MRVYTYSQARQEFSELLNRARREGEVQVGDGAAKSWWCGPQSPRARLPT